MPMHQSLHRRQSNAAPLEFLVVMQLLKHSEEPARIFGIEAGAVVAHCINSAPFLAPSARLNRRTRLALCEFDRIAQQLLQDGAQKIRISPSFGQSVNVNV